LTLYRLVPWIAVSLIVLTIVLMAVWASGQTTCGEPSTGSPGWANTAYTTAVVTMFAAIGVGLVSLLVRRWLVGLAAVVLPPVIYLMMALFQLC
jgi:hypothetical protein